MIRVVLDTNIVVSALLQPLGPPAQVLVLALSGSIQLCVSGSVYAEYEEVIRRPRFQRSANIIAATLPSPDCGAPGYSRERILGEPVRTSQGVLRPDDDMFLECAMAAKAEYVVTGNLKHFPVSWAGNLIVTPRWLIEKVLVVKP